MNVGKKIHSELIECSDVYHLCDGVKIIAAPGKTQEENDSIWKRIQQIASEICSKK